MPEIPIEALLGGLDDELQPDLAFETRLRRRLVDELAVAPDTTGTNTATPLEVVELELTRTPDAAGTNRRWFAAATAAAAIVVVLGAIAVFRDGDRGADRTAEDPIVSTLGPGRSFAGASIEAATIEGGGNPYWVTAGSDLWVMSLEGDLTRLDRVTLDPIGSLSVHESSDMAEGAGAVWVADALTGDVIRIDPFTVSPAATITTGIEVDPATNRPIGVPQASGPERPMALIGGIGASDDAVWVGDHAGRLLEIDPESNSVVREVAIDLRPDLLRLDAGTLLVGDLGAGTIAVLDEATGDEITRFGPIDRLVGADLGAGAAYLLDGTDGVVTRVDLGTGSVTSSDPLGASWNVAGQPVYDAGVVVGDAGVLLETDDGFFVLDPVTLEPLGEIEIPGTGGDMTIGADGTAWVVRYSARTVARVVPVAVED